MAQTSRISRSNSKFNDYANSTVAYLDTVDPSTGVANYVRLGLTVAQRNAWAAKKNDWNAIYAVYVNVATRTKPVTEDKEEAMRAFIVLVQPLLNIIAASPTIINDDYAAFHIKKRDTKPTARGPISTAPDVALSPLQGAKIRQRLRYDTDENRASMHPLADGWEKAVKIGGTAPANPSECPIRVTGSKALTTFDAGMDNDRKPYYAFYRWVNITNPVNNSGWSSMKLVTISGGTVVTE